MARNFARNGMRFFEPAIDGAGIGRAGSEFPLYSYIVGAIFRAFGEAPWLARLPSILITMVSVWWFYGLVAARGGPFIGFIAAWAMCVIPVHLYFTRTVQPESMALAAFIGFVFFWDRWHARRRRRDWLAAVLLGALAAGLKTPFLYLVAGIWLILNLEPRWRARRDGVVMSRQTLWRAVGGWGSAIALPVMIVLTGAWYRYAKTAPVQVLPLRAEYHIANLLPVFGWQLWRKQFISFFPEVMATYSGLLLGLFGVWRLVKRRETVATPFFVLGWWFVTAFYTIALGQYGLIHRYTQIPWAPINAILIAVGFVSLWQGAGQTGPLRRQRTLALVLLVGIPVHAALRTRHWYHVHSTYLLRAKNVISTLSRPDELLLVNTAEVTVPHYHLDRKGYVVDLARSTPAEVERLLQNPIRYFLTPRDKSWTEHPAWAHFFAKRGRVVHEDQEFLIYEFRERQ